MRRILLTVFVFCFAQVSFAQTTAVTGVVKDTNGVAYAGATMKAQLVTTAGSPITGQPTVTLSTQTACTAARAGTAPCQVPFAGTAGPWTLDSGGNIPGGGINLQDNSLITPASTQWLFSLTSSGSPPPLGTGPQVCTAQITITGVSQSVSSSFSGCPALSAVTTPVPGSNTQVIFNNNGALGANPGFTVTNLSTDPLVVINGPSNGGTLQIGSAAGAFGDSGGGRLILGGNSNVAGITLSNLQPAIGGTNGYLSVPNGFISPIYNTAANCSSSASPAVCGAAAAGSVVIAAAATSVTVNTTAVTANSQISIVEDDSLGTKLSVTCNTTSLGATKISARVPGTSFTITTAVAPTTNPACLSYSIVN